MPAFNFTLIPMQLIPMHIYHMHGRLSIATGNLKSCKKKKTPVEILATWNALFKSICRKELPQKLLPNRSFGETKLTKKATGSFLKQGLFKLVEQTGCLGILMKGSGHHHEVAALRDTNTKCWEVRSQTSSNEIRRKLPNGASFRSKDDVSWDLL